MKKAVAEKWVAALRSKQYTQGRKALKTKSPRGVVRHCCLGVLCELYQKDRRGNKAKPVAVDSFLPEGPGRFEDTIPIGSRIFAFDDNYGTLPQRVIKWAGMSSEDGELGESVFFDGDSVDNLAALNDSGANFYEIAEVIEQHVKVL